MTQVVGAGDAVVGVLVKRADSVSEDGHAVSIAALYAPVYHVAVRLTLSAFLGEKLEVFLSLSFSVCDCARVR